jgi:hypothetical protein
MTKPIQVPLVRTVVQLLKLRLLPQRKQMLETDSNRRNKRPTIMLTKRNNLYHRLSNPLLKVLLAAPTL